jgi:hypothetical protein
VPLGVPVLFIKCDLDDNETRSSSAYDLPG